MLNMLNCSAAASAVWQLVAAAWQQAASAARPAASAVQQAAYALRQAASAARQAAADARQVAADAQQAASAAWQAGLLRGTVDPKNDRNHGIIIFSHTKWNCQEKFTAPGILLHEIAF